LLTALPIVQLREDKERKKDEFDFFSCLLLLLIPARRETLGSLASPSPWPLLSLCVVVLVSQKREGE
jgi:hypothetical protein